MRRSALLPALLALAVAVVLLAPTGAVAGTQRHKLTTYPGFGVVVYRHMAQIDRLDGTSKSFRKFVTRRLNNLWRQWGSRAACENGVSITVKRYRSDGWAYGAEGFATPSGHPASCSGGGYYSVYHRAHGRWRIVLSGQEAPGCQQLKRAHVPAEIGFGACYPKNEIGADLVAYPNRHPRLTFAGFDGVSPRWTFNAAQFFTWGPTDTDWCGLDYFNLAGMRFTDMGRATGHHRGKVLAMWTGKAGVLGPHRVHAGMTNAQVAAKLGAGVRHRMVGYAGHSATDGLYQTYLVRPDGRTLWFFSVDSGPDTKTAVMGLTRSRKLARAVAEPISGC